MMTDMPHQQIDAALQANWYALHSHAHKESFLQAELTARGFNAYYPCLHVKPVNPRSHKIRPYFPGYLFVQLDADHIRETDLRWMPHSYGLVSFGDEPSPVPEALINRIRQQLDTAHTPPAPVTFAKGEPVELRQDLFRGYEAVFDATLAGTERVRVLLKLLNNNPIAVEVNLDQVKKAK
jgi:transcriptional antiterminator RfaH